MSSKLAQSKVYIGNDHAGFALKRVLRDYLRELGYEVEDLGAHTFEAEDDYPVFSKAVAEKVAQESGSMGIIVAATGQGEAMAANRFPGVRAAVFYGGAQALLEIESEGTLSADHYDIIRLARLHNNANVLSLGARFVSEKDAKEATKTFLETPFSNASRHVRRIDSF